MRIACGRAPSRRTRRCRGSSRLRARSTAPTPAGIVHRDVKPANLLLADDETIRVSDFGIARAADQDTLTAVGSVLGSVGYMAPEQARGEPSSPASDRYGLACVAFELLTGRRPFERESQAAEAAAHAQETPPSARQLDPSLPARCRRRLRAWTCEAARGAASDECRLRRRPARGLGGRPGAETTVFAASTRPAAPTSVRYASRPRGVAVLLGAIGLLGAGAVLAWAVTGLGDGGSSTVVLTQSVPGKASTVVVTETTPGQTVERTVTADAGAQPQPAGGSGSALNDRGFRMLQAGDAQGALPVLESAIAALRGSSTITEAYASYNLAVARFALGRCDGVAELLDRSEQIQGGRKEIERLRKQVEKRCEGDGPED